MAEAGRQSDGTPSDGTPLHTDRLILRHREVGDAPVMHQLWTERDPRAPAHRRIDADGRPTVADIADGIRGAPASGAADLLAVVLADEMTVIGYCGLLVSERVPADEPEIAFELVRRFQGQGYATEAAAAVLAWGRWRGHRRVWATVWEWNHPSRRVLAKVGFTETGRTEVDPVHGTTLFESISLRP